MFANVIHNTFDRNVGNCESVGETLICDSLLHDVVWDKSCSYCTNQDSFNVTQ